MVDNNNPTTPPRPTGDARLAGDPDVGPATEGGTGEKRRATRGRRGRVTNVGGHRVVNYFEFTKYELDMLGTKRREAATSFAVATFAAGVVGDGIKDMILNPPTDATAKGVWVTLMIVAVVAMVYYFFEGLRRSQAATSFLQEIKDDHDFDN